MNSYTDALQSFRPKFTTSDIVRAMKERKRNRNKYRNLLQSQQCGTAGQRRARREIQQTNALAEEILHEIAEALE